MSELTTIRFCPDFKDADADLILASSDGVHFRVHKLILGKASPVFLDMFAIPTSLDGTEGPQTVQLTESSWAVEAMLRMCYPMKRSKPSSLNEATTLLAIGRKYSMDAVVDGATSIVASWRYTEEDAPGLEVFASGVHIGDRQLIERGVVECLRRPLFDLIDETATGLGLIPGSTLKGLFEFHRNCTTTAMYAAIHFTWPNYEDQPWCSDCQSHIFLPEYSNKRNLKWYNLDGKWWDECAKEFRRVFESRSASPLNSMRLLLPSAHFRPPPCTMTCRRCLETGSSELMKVMLAVVEKIDEAVMKNVRDRMAREAWTHGGF